MGQLLFFLYVMKYSNIIVIRNVIFKDKREISNEMLLANFKGDGKEERKWVFEVLMY